MLRWTQVRFAVIAVVAMGGLALVAGARAASAGGSVCKTFSTAGLKLEWSVIGNVSCSQAKPWLVKILAVRGKPGAKAVIKVAPAGFHCLATDDAKGRPSAGGCFTGTAAFPKNGFQWLG